MKKKSKFKHRRSYVAEIMFLTTKPKVVKDKTKYSRKEKYKTPDYNSGVIFLFFFYFFIKYQSMPTSWTI